MEVANRETLVNHKLLQVVVVVVIEVDLEKNQPHSVQSAKILERMLNLNTYDDIAQVSPTGHFFSFFYAKVKTLPCLVYTVL